MKLYTEPLTIVATIVFIIAEAWVTHAIDKRIMQQDGITIEEDCVVEIKNHSNEVISYKNGDCEVNIEPADEGPESAT